MPPRKRRVLNVEPPPPEENPGVYVVVVHDRSIATTNALARVCDAYLTPIIDRLRTLTGTDNVQMARLVYTKPSPVESPDLVSYKSRFSPVTQAIASMRVGAPGEPTEPLALVDAITLALQMFDDQSKRSTSMTREPMLHILVATSNPPQLTANRQDDRSLSQWKNAPLQIRQHKAGLSLILLSPPNRHLLAFFEQIAGEATTPWFPVKTDEVHLSGLSEHVASAQPNAPQPQGRKRRRDDDDEDNEATSSGPCPKKSPRKSARTAEEVLPPATLPISLPLAATDPLVQPQPSDSRPNLYSAVETLEASYRAGPGTVTGPTDHTDAHTGVDANGRNWAPLANLGVYLNQPDAFSQTDFGGQYAAGSPDVGAFFSDNSLAAASYAHAAPSAGVHQFSTFQSASSSGVPFNLPPNRQHDLSASPGQIRRDAISPATPAEARSYVHSAVSTTSQHGGASILADVVAGGIHSPGHALTQVPPDRSATTSNWAPNAVGPAVPAREDQLPVQHFGIPQTIQFSSTTPSRAALQLQSSHVQHASPNNRSQLPGRSNLSKLPKASELSSQLASAAGQPQSASNPRGPISARVTMGNSPMQSFSPRHTSQQQLLQQASPRPLSHHTPSSTASHDSPSAPPKIEATGDKENPNQPIFSSGHIVGGNPSKVTLMVAISVDGLFFDGPTPKRLRVPITVISSPDQNVRTDLWPKPTFAVTPDSLSGPVIWQEFFAYLAKEKIPTCSLRANTRTAGGIRAFEVDYLTSFDKTCRMLIERTSFARVPFRVPGGPPEAGIALFPSVEQQGAGVSLHAAYFGSINIPRAEDISPSAKTKKEPKEPTDTLPAPVTTGIPPSPIHRSSLTLTPIHTTSPAGIIPPLPYPPSIPVAGPSVIPPGPRIQPVPAHSTPEAQLIGGRQHRAVFPAYPPSPGVSPYSVPVPGRGPLPQRSTSYSIYSPTTQHQQPFAYRPSHPPRVATAPYNPTIGTWSASPVVSSPDTLIGQYSALSPRRGMHLPMAPTYYEIPAPTIAEGNASGNASFQTQPVVSSQPIYGVYEPQQFAAVNIPTSAQNRQVQSTSEQPSFQPGYPSTNYQGGQQIASSPDTAGASALGGTPYSSLVGTPPPQSQPQPQTHPQGGYGQNPYPYPYPYPYSQS